MSLAAVLLFLIRARFVVVILALIVLGAGFSSRGSSSRNAFTPGMPFVRWSRLPRRCCCCRNRRAPTRRSSDIHRPTAASRNRSPAGARSGDRHLAAWGRPARHRRRQRSRALHRQRSHGGLRDRRQRLHRKRGGPHGVHAARGGDRVVGSVSQPLVSAGPPVGKGRAAHGRRGDVRHLPAGAAHHPRGASSAAPRAGRCCCCSSPCSASRCSDWS